MTQEQRRKTKEALGFYGQRNWGYGPRNWGWKKAIEQTEAYYREADPGLRGGILQLRYMERRTREEVMDKLNISYSTYQKAHSDLLSTIAVFAAHYGELGRKNALRPERPEGIRVLSVSFQGCRSAGGRRHSCRRSPRPSSRLAWIPKLRPGRTGPPAPAR